ncbi:MAG: hypothetical protein IJS14_13740 [Lentisphaeria bacterium]|nr:hypothetical protein [Lentisphaeria bacterium]
MKKHIFVLLETLCLLLFCAACGDSSDKQKTSDRETNSSDIPSSREQSKHSAPAEKEKTQTDRSQKAGEEKKQDLPPSAQPGNPPRASAPRKDANGKSSASRPGGEESSGGGKSGGPDKHSHGGGSSASRPGGGESSGGGQSGGGKSAGSGTPSSGGRQSPQPRSGRSIPSGWMSSAVNDPPPPDRLEIWNKILSKLQNLIIARQVKFSPLGSAHASLSALSDGRYKATGRCMVTEKDGDQLAYEFECIAVADEYAARILSVDFRSPNE